MPLFKLLLLQDKVLSLCPADLNALLKVFSVQVGSVLTNTAMFAVSLKGSQL